LSTHYQVHATEGNFNNLIGVPKTLFLLKKSDEIAVVEMGMNDFGEIARLTEITRPTVGLITNIGTAHLEKLRDLQGVARAKGELFAGLKPDAAALVNLSDAEIAKLPTPAQKKGYGTAASGIWGEIQKAPQGDPRPLHLKIHIKEETLALALQIPGSHNLSNVLAALAVGNHFNIPLPDVKRALENFTPAPSRMELKRLKDGKMLIDDCYNANPASTSAALKTLADMKNDGTSLAVLGDMLELGDFTTEGHLKVGREAAVQKTDYLIGIGAHAATLLDGAKSAGMASDRLYAFANADAAKKKVQELYKKVDWILVKGSRENHLENVVSYLKGSS
jgi:UDP-N-acetylmuramoyl-tripeptide--D-alanyl-D-alanine ligase